MVIEQGVQEPRIKLIPEGEDHPKWDEVVEFVAALGVTLDPWQWMVLRAALRRRAGLWAAFAVAVCAPRQNGKNGILEIRELIGPLVLGEKLLIHTAHLADTSKEAFRRLDDLIDANEWLSKQVRHIWRTNGHESIEFKDRRRIRFRTRTRGGGRGFAGSPVFFDEAMFLPTVSMGAILPVITAQPDPQVWYMGSAVDQEFMEDGVVFAGVRERAIKGDDERLAYFEWSLDVDSPEELDEDVASEPATWAQANPAFGIRILPETIAAEREEMDNRTFAVERLGVGDWPQPGSGGILDMELWASLLDPESKLRDPVVLAFDVSPNRSKASICAAGSRDDEFFHLEVIDNRTGTGWVVPRIAELVHNHGPAAVVCDGVGPAASLVSALEQDGIAVEPTNVSEHAQACGLLIDMVKERKVRHLGSDELKAAIRGASTRPLGDAWAWSRKSSGTDITPLVASTLALWKAEASSVGSFAFA